MLTTILVACLLGLLSYFYRKRKKDMQIFERMGIPGPKPNFLFGNLLSFRTTPLYRKQQQWREEFGETYGYFEGPTPVLVTSNVNLLQEVFVKQFSKFHARKLWPVQVDPDKDEDVHLFFARGRRWRRLRNIVSPTFTASKMKNLTPTVNDCINRLLDVVKVQSVKNNDDRSVEVFELFRRITLDTILRCEMGLDPNSVENEDDPFLHHCKGVIDDTTKNPWLYTLGFIFPTLHTVWIIIYKFLHNIKFNPVFWLEDRMRELVQLRRELNEDRGDLIQQMLNAQFDVEHFTDLDQSNDKEGNSGRQPKSMTNEEIVSHALLFLLAGYETTSTTLAYVFYELSQCLDVQHRLRQEVMAVLPRGYHSIEYEDLKKLKYLDYVIWETLRKYPLASTIIARQCMTPCTVAGIDMPQDMLVHANLWDIHHDPRHWGDNPHEFDPLRFTPEKRKQRHQMAWMPFGGGPRACAGVRFAFLQLKMVVAKVLRDYDFHPSHRLSVPLNLKQGATILPADGVHLAAMRRGSAMSDCGNSRRGSFLTGLDLEEHNSVNNAGRRSSFQEEEDDDNEVNEHACFGKLRRASVPRIFIENSQPLHQDSGSFDESLESDPRALRRDSLMTGFELLRRASLTKGLELLMKSSNADLRVDETPLRKPSLENLLLKTDDDANMQSVNTDDSLNKYRRMPRRSSALPVLESVGEYKELKSFLPTSNGFANKEIWQRRMQSNRLAHRRGSG